MTKKERANLDYVIEMIEAATNQLRETWENTPKNTPYTMRKAIEAKAKTLGHVRGMLAKI